MSENNKKRVPWNKGLTKETDSRIAKAELKKKQTVLQKYGVSNVFQSKEVIDKLSEDRHSGKLAQKAAETKEARYGDPHYNNMSKTKQTKLKNYGDANYNNVEKFKATCITKYGVSHPSSTPEGRTKISNARLANNSQAKALITITKKYGSLQNYYDEVALKSYNTRKKNKTLGSVESGPERQLYNELCEKYGSENVIKQYYDKERYPFKCDFYIISEDKFIELNGFWTHNDHPFDKNNPADIEYLEKLKSENTDWSKSVIYTWTNLDVRKLETAKKNNLNFEMIYWYNR